MTSKLPLRCPFNYVKHECEESYKNWVDLKFHMAKLTPLTLAHWIAEKQEPSDHYEGHSHEDSVSIMKDCIPVSKIEERIKQHEDAIKNWSKPEKYPAYFQGMLDELKSLLPK